MLLSCEKGLFLPYNSGSPHIWTTKLYVAIETCQTICWCNGIATACLKLVLQHGEILTKKQCNFESIDSCLEMFV